VFQETVLCVYDVTRSSICSHILNDKVPAGSCQCHGLSHMHCYEEARSRDTGGSSEQRSGPRYHDHHQACRRTTVSEHTMVWCSKVACSQHLIAADHPAMGGTFILAVLSPCRASIAYWPMQRCNSLFIMSIAVIQGHH